MREWTHSQAVALCCAIEQVCPDAGCHVALTGGLLYREGLRKDCDLLFYRIRQVARIDMDELWGALGTLGVKRVSGFGWCYKAEWCGKPIDCLFPEEQGNGGTSNSPNAVEDALAGAETL